MNSTRTGSGWLRWFGLLLASVALAVAADSWLPLSGTRWASLIWAPALTLSIVLVFSTLWQLLSPLMQPSVRPTTSARRTQRDPQAYLRDLQRTGGYWAVKIQPSDNGACEAARAAQSRVYDLYRAPPLPLPECPNKRCRCSYVGLPERRRRDILPPGMTQDRRRGSTKHWNNGQNN